MQGATHKHSLGSISAYYKKENGVWMLWKETSQRWVRAIVNTVNTQNDGTPWGFVLISESERNN